MNIFTNFNRYTSKFVGGVAMFAMILSALPVHFFVAEAAAPTVLFTDDFEVNPAFSNPAWTSSPQWGTTGSSANTGSKKVKVEGNESGSTTLVSPTINATGYESISLSFWYKQEGFEADDNLVVEWFDGTNWYTLKTFVGETGDSEDVTVWTLETLSLGSGADNNSDVRLRFTANLDAGSDKFFLDTLSLTGEETVVVEPSPTVSVCTDTTVLTSYNLDNWDTSETRATGHNEIVSGALRVWTESNGTTDKAAGYYTTNFLLSEMGDQTIADSFNYTTNSGTIPPGLQMVVDFDEDNSPDGILVGEAAYGNNWWLAGASQFVKDNAPNNGGGYGSLWYGTPNEWLTKFPQARVMAIGYSLGSGVQGDYEITSIKLGCVDYRFDLAPKATETIVITGNTSAGENLPGWMFNRDITTKTPFEFNLVEKVIGNGALYVKPITNTYPFATKEGNDKFIAEYFPAGGAMPVADFDSFSYDFKIGNGGTASDAGQFYLSVYTNLTNPTGFYDCRYNYIPSTGSTGSFTTFSAVGSSAANSVAARNSSTCPAKMSDLPSGSTIRAFAINMGDTSMSDTGLDGYFDNVVLETKTKVTTFDFEPIPDTTNPDVTIKDGAITCEEGYSKVSFKLHDAGKIDKVILNGVVKELSNNVWSDLNDVEPGKFGAVEGINVLQVYDVTGNMTEITFTLCDDPSSAPTATVKEGSEFTMTCDEGYSMLSYKLHDEDKIDRVVINGVVKDLTDNKWSDINFLKPGVFGAVVGENTMIVYDVNGNNSTYTFFLCGEVLKSTVTMCKVDEQENKLSGWTLMLLGDKIGDYVVPANDPAGVDTSALAGNTSHVVISEGTWDNNRGPLNIVDAEYSTEDNWVSSIMDGFTGYGADILELFVGGTNGNWGDYNESHKYVQPLLTTTSGPVNLAINDSYYSDNTGELNASVYEGFTGVTGENGCVTFTDVPYGSYNVEELMQTGFENTSGLDAVEVDAETETFTVINNDLSYVPPCEMTAYSDEGTVVVENNTYATSTYTHNNWTASIPGAEWIWETYRVIDTTVNTVKTFEETFTVTDPTSAVLDIGADNGYRVFVNGVMVVDRSTYENNFQTHTQKTFTSEVMDQLVSGENTMRIEVTNKGVARSNDRTNPAGVLYKLVVNAASNCEVTTETETIDREPEPEAMFEINGFKYEVTESENIAVAGWTINVTDGDYSTTTTTEADGSYSFMLPAGDWTVSEEMQTGWLQSSVHENGSIVTDDEGLEVCTINLNVEGLSTNACDFYNQQEVESIEETDTTTSRSSSSGTRTRLAPAPAGQVLGVSTTSMCPFLNDYLKLGANNDTFEVMKLQLFLSTVMGYENPATGFFGPITETNVKAFQARYSNEVLTPWFTAGITPNENPTGYVFKTTKWKINDIICPGFEAFPVLTE